jgi:hypothetical protein
MSPLGIVLIVILALVLLGGVGPHVYPGTPWRPGYGFGWGGNGVLTVILIIILILWLTGRI